MRKTTTAFVLLILVCVFIPFAAQSALAQGNDPPIPPAPTDGNVVLDELGWLTPEQENEINAVNQKLDLDGIAQIAVVTLDDCGADKQRFRNDLFRTWGIGHASDNDGLLILVCWYGGDSSRRSVEQETGYSLEGDLPDILTAQVARDTFVPAFQANQPGRGLVQMVHVYDRLLRKLPTPQPDSFSDGAAPGSEQGSANETGDQGSSNPSTQSGNESTAALGFFGGVGLILVLIIALIARRAYREMFRKPVGKIQLAEQKRKRGVLKVGTLVILAMTIYLALKVDPTLALIAALVAFIILLIVLAAPRGAWAFDWNDVSRHDGGSSGGDSFGGGSSGGGGSSTDF